MAKAQMITVLSIDGGGIRGIIPALQLAYLEKKLKELDGNNFTKIADYFDVIAGTSTGGLMATILGAPRSKGETNPIMEAWEIPQFYEDECPKIFPQPRDYPPLGPKYDGVYLRELTKKLAGETKLQDTLTEVVLPAFELKQLMPVIFSTTNAQTDALKNAKLQDACLATSAAAPLLPAHKFEINTEDGQHTRIYDVVDGGLVAANPTLIAIAHVAEKILTQKTKFVDIEPMDTGRMLVLSLGCGESTQGEKYNADFVNLWHYTSWIFSLLVGTSPIAEMLSASSFAMVDIYTSTLFQSSHSLDNYLRIQADSLEGDQTKSDLATPENMRSLKEVGENLLKKTITRRNLETGKLEPVPGGPTNEEALAALAIKLSQERKSRLAK